VQQVKAERDHYEVLTMEINKELINKVEIEGVGEQHPSCRGGSLQFAASKDDILDSSLQLKLHQKDSLEIN
jgi:hypothetical protein